MAKQNTQPLRVDLEERSQGTNAGCDKPKLTSDREKEPIVNETDTGPVAFPLVKALSALGSSPEEVEFLWPYSVNHNCCCIYRVPCRLRRVNPEAYTPQMLLIGPLHHSMKAQAGELSKTDLRYSDYIKMERHKEKYLENFRRKFGSQMVEEFTRIIKRDEQIVRACYAETTDSIESKDFVKMMLHEIDKTGDFLFGQLPHSQTIYEDLILLENQLPYALLENLFETFFSKLGVNLTFRQIILRLFGFEQIIKTETKFLHFTDLVRLVRVETLGPTETEQNAKLVRKKTKKSLHNADELDSAGVIFAGTKDERDEINTSLVIKFEGGILTMPCFTADMAPKGF